MTLFQVWPKKTLPGKFTVHKQMYDRFMLTFMVRKFMDNEIILSSKLYAEQFICYQLHVIIYDDKD